MKKLYNLFLKKKAIEEIKRIGDGICEIILDIPISFTTINTIEIDEIDDRILLHVFEYPDFDTAYDFEDLDIEDKIIIIKSLKTI
jgi:hypothetical protein